MNDFDQTLADTTPAAAVTQPGLADAATSVSTRQLTVNEILDMARLPEARASVCLRADLEAEHEELIAELATLVDANGELIVDAEASIADQTKAARAQQLADRDAAVLEQMRSAMWRPLFRGLSTEAAALFDKQHMPKAKNAGDPVDWNDYNDRLIAATAVDPEMTVEDAAALRSTLGSRAYASILGTAKSVCVAGGVDVPKSPTFSLGPKEN